MKIPVTLRALMLALIALSVMSCGILGNQGEEGGGRPTYLSKPAGEKVSLFGGKVYFSPPKGFSQLSDEMIAKKFPAAIRPGLVYANNKRTVCVAVGFPEQQNLRSDQMPKFKTFMESFIEKSNPGLKWLNKEFVTINGMEWIHLEFISSALDTDIHNDMYITTLEDRALIFNFNSTVGEYEDYKVDLEASKETIEIKRR